MISILSIILLQINLFGAATVPLTDTKVYAEDAISGEVVAFCKIGQNGKFKFSNLDQGNYLISMEVPESAVKKIDKKSRQKFDTDIEVAFNINKEIYCWQRDDGFVTLEITDKSKIAEPIVPKYSIKEEETKLNEENDYANKNNNATQNRRICILQFTVAGQYGTFGGLLTSVGQKEFHNLTVGKKDITLEDAGVVKVLKRIEN